MFLISSYVFNYKKLFESVGYLIFISIYEAVLSYIVIGLFFLQGYSDYFFYMFITIVFIFILSILITYVTRDRDESWDLQLETVKNNLLLFMKTLLPLYLFLIIFRFYNPILQVILSVGLTVCLFIITKKYRPKFHGWLKVKIRNFSIAKPSTYLLTWIIVGLLFISLIFINPPTDIITSALNLSDKAPYMVYDDDIATDADNNFKQKTLLTLKFEISEDDEVIDEVVDYAYDESYYYIYLSSEIVSIYNTDGNYIDQLDLYSDYHEDYPNRSFSHTDEYKYFLEYDNKLLLFAEYGIFVINGESYTRISELSARDTKYYFYNNELKLHNRETVNISNIYSYSSDSFVLDETVNKNDESWLYLIQISDSLFYYLDDKAYLYHNPSISFEFMSTHTKTYDSKNVIMYYREYQEIQGSNESKVDLQTEYVKINSSGNSTSTILEGNRSFNILARDNSIYLCGGNRLEVIGGSDLSYLAMMNHLDYNPFFFLDEYIYSDRYMYSFVDENTLEYIESYTNSNELVVRICEIQEKNVYIDLPFYTHYGILTIIPIAIAALSDFTDYRNNTKEKSFKNLFNRKEKAE